MVLQLQVWALMLLQEASPAVSFDPRSMWNQMGWPARLMPIVTVRPGGISCTTRRSCSTRLI